MGFCFIWWVGGMRVFRHLRQRPLIASMLALFSSALLGRVMGAVYRVVLVRVAGQDAVGIIQLSFPVYRIARSLGTLGMPIAIAKLTAERTQQAGRPDFAAYKLGLKITAYATLTAFLVQALFSNFWANTVLADSRTEPAIVVLALLLLPISYTSAQRGAVQGLQKQSYLAGADVAEVLCRIPATLLLVIWLAPKGVAWAAAGVAAGYIIGELASALVLHYALQSKKATRGRRKAPKLQPRPLLALSLPLMATNLLNNMMSLITVALIPRLLQSAGYTATAATRAYGRLSGMAIPALYMPMMLVYPVVSVALPEITRLATQKSARATQRLQWLLQRVFLGTAVVTVIVAPLLWYQGYKIALILYGDATVGELIRPLALSVPFTFFGSVISGVLYGFGKTSWTMLSSIAGNLLRILLVYTLAGQPEWGIMGVLWAVIADNALTALLAGVGLLWIFARRNSKR